MKADLLSIEGRKVKEIELPKVFSADIREDIVTRVLETKKKKQPYSPSPVAGKQSSARGKLVHRRHVWKSQYGRGISRVPRKIFSRRGTQFNWEASEIPSAKGGMRAHPPKILSMINTKKINKKELKTALISALSATAHKKNVLKKYKTLEEIRDLPLVIESKITSLKTKEILSVLEKILGKSFNVALKKKNIRSGKGKMRGRKYKTSAGILWVVGSNEKLKTKALEIKSVKNLGVNDLAKGGLGRLTIYTENAIKEIGEKLKQ